jgi:hypothetical protein
MMQQLNASISILGALLITLDFKNLIATSLSHMSTSSIDKLSLSS